MKNAIVTGSSKGLGKAIAEALSEMGYRVWISARKLEELNRTKKEIEAKSGNGVRIHSVDFSQGAQVKTYAEMLLGECETMDVLVNNAGIFIPDSLLEEGALDQQMTINFQSAYDLTQALLPRFVKQKAGNIFNVCSVVNRKPRVDAASYTISKFALWGYHKVLHQSMLEHGVKVTAFFPSSINTASWDWIDAPKEDFIQPEDIASLVVNVLGMKRGTVPSEIDLSSINPEF
jgi:short-subunit dehydrogenase